MKASALIAAILFPLATQAQPAVERVLLPIYLEQPVPGAHGSIWATEFAVHSPSLPLRILTCADEVCLLIGFPDENIAPGETKTRLPQRYLKSQDGGPGAVVAIEGGVLGADPKSVRFQLRIADRSRSDLNAGTEIPVIREPDYLTSTMQLLNVPNDPRFRLTFRLYEMNFTESDFVVRIYDQAKNVLLAERSIQARARPQLVRFEPAYAEVGDLSSPAFPERIRVDVKPLTHGAAYWTFISITNNDTQHVTLVTPQ